MTARGRSRGAASPAMAVLAVLLSLAGLHAGCKSRPVPPPEPRALPALGAVTVTDATGTPERPASIDARALGAAIGARLRATGLFSAAQPDAGPPAGPIVRARCQIAIEGAEVEDKGVARAVVRLRLETRPSQSMTDIDEDLRGQGERVYAIPKGARLKVDADKNAIFTKLALSIAGDLIDGFAAREKLRDAAPAAIHAAIRGDAGELREEAIRIAGERRLRDEVPALIGLLEDPSESVRDTALGALIAIGDQRAVTALAKSRSFRDHREMRKILEAIAAIGGEEAQDYLAFVAETHDDPEIRELAKTAKHRLEHRRDAARQGVAGE